jgi:hypothetical protein
VETMWPDTVASSVFAFKVHWVVVYSETFLTLNLLTTTIIAPPSNTSKWQMGFNSAFKGLMSAIPLRAWRKSAALFIVGRGLGPSTMYSARIRLPG